MQKVHFCKQCTNKNVISLNRSKSICIYNKLICTALGNKGVSSELLPKEIDKFKFWNDLLYFSCREGSESDSHGSSVESLLEKRKPDPEEVLLSLGFGGKYNSESRIPQRFLQPSKLKGVGFNDFLRHQQEMVQNFETGFCGYRGLSGDSLFLLTFPVSRGDSFIKRFVYIWN